MSLTPINPKETFAPEVHTALNRAIQIAREDKCNYIGCGHILLGILDNKTDVVYKALKTLDFDLNNEIKQLRKAILPQETLPPVPEKLDLTQSGREAIKLMVSHARRKGQRTIKTPSLFIGTITSPFMTAASAFADTNNITPEVFTNALQHIIYNET